MLENYTQTLKKQGIISKRRNYEVNIICKSQKDWFELYNLLPSKLE